MKYLLKGGQTPEDILFWMVSLTRDRFPNASLYIEGEVIGRQQLSVGLDEAMYARCCPLDEPFDLLLERRNGDAISYEAAYPRSMRIFGLDSFVEEVMALPPPSHHLTLLYGDMWTRGQFQQNVAFLQMSAVDQLRCCLKIARQTGMKMLVSAVENGGKAVLAASSAMLLGYKNLIDIVLRKDSDTWVFFHIATGMVYTSGLELTEVEDLLRDLIITEEDIEDIEE